MYVNRIAKRGIKATANSIFEQLTQTSPSWSERSRFWFSRPGQTDSNRLSPTRRLSAWSLRRRRLRGQLSHCNRKVKTVRENPSPERVGPHVTNGWSKRTLSTGPTWKQLPEKKAEENWNASETEMTDKDVRLWRFTAKKKIQIIFVWPGKGRRRQHKL